MWKDGESQLIKWIQWQTEFQRRMKFTPFGPWINWSHTDLEAHSNIYYQLDAWTLVFLHEHHTPKSSCLYRRTTQFASAAYQPLPWRQKNDHNYAIVGASICSHYSHSTLWQHGQFHQLQNWYFPRAEKQCYL